MHKVKLTINKTKSDEKLPVLSGLLICLIQIDQTNHISHMHALKFIFSL